MITDKTTSTPTPVINKKTINITEIDTAAILTVGPAETIHVCRKHSMFLVRHVLMLSNATNLFPGQLESLSPQW